MSTRKHTSTLYVCARASSLSFAHPQDLMRSRSSHGTKQHKSGDCPRTELSEDTPNYEVATFENRNLLFRSADKVQMSPTPMAHERGSAGLLTDTPQPASALPIRHKGLQPEASLPKYRFCGHSYRRDHNLRRRKLSKASARCCSSCRPSRPWHLDRSIGRRPGKRPPGRVLPPRSKRPHLRAGP